MLRICSGIQTQRALITPEELERVRLLPVPGRNGELGVGALQEILVEDDHVMALGIGPVIDEAEVPRHRGECVEQVCR